MFIAPQIKENSSSFRSFEERVRLRNYKHFAPNGARSIAPITSCPKDLPGALLDTLASAQLDSPSLKYVAQVVNLRSHFIPTSAS
jgi:hypothetical protein